eukprot:639584-Rhodomonas_salina.2
MINWWPEGQLCSANLSSSEERAQTPTMVELSPHSPTEYGAVDSEQLPSKHTAPRGQLRHADGPDEGVNE